MSRNIKQLASGFKMPVKNDVYWPWKENRRTTHDIHYRSIYTAVAVRYSTHGVRLAFISDDVISRRNISKQKPASPRVENLYKRV